MKWINWITISTVIYVIAVVLYCFKNVGSPLNGFYHNLISTFMLGVVFFGALRKNNNELDKSFLIAIVLIKVFNLICHLVWLVTGHDELFQPYYFCAIVAVCFFIGIVINKKILWK